MTAKLNSQGIPHCTKALLQPWPPVHATSHNSLLYCMDLQFWSPSSPFSRHADTRTLQSYKRCLARAGTWRRQVPLLECMHGLGSKPAACRQI